jgi:serine/threonine protein phosphatase PrpC
MSAAPTAITIDVAARTDVGCVRERNEDAHLVADLGAGRRGVLADVERHEPGARGSLFAVCDGMGGAAAGDYASALAVDVLYGEMREAPEPGGDVAVAARLLRRAVRAANLRLWQESQASTRRRGMGTTVSAALTCGDHVVLAQVGDSRAYLWRAGVLTQVTRDQSVVSALVNAGRLTPEEAKSFAGSNVILQAVGVADDVEVSLSLVELRRGDTLLVCSDGLHHPVGDEGLAELFAAHDDLGGLAAGLVERARARGGPDNITLVLARFGGEELREPAGPEDLPRFSEFDPAEEGERAVTSTSRVARRLAARAGMADDTPVKPLPATGQHPALTDAEVRRAAKRSLVAEPTAGASGGMAPARDALEAGSRLGAWAWVVAVLAAAGLAALAWWRA